MNPCWCHPAVDFIIPFEVRIRPLCFVDFGILFKDFWLTLTLVAKSHGLMMLFHCGKLVVYFTLGLIHRTSTIIIIKKQNSKNVVISELVHSSKILYKNKRRKYFNTKIDNVLFTTWHLYIFHPVLIGPAALFQVKSGCFSKLWTYQENIKRDTQRMIFHMYYNK